MTQRQNDLLQIVIIYLLIAISGWYSYGYFKNTTDSSLVALLYADLVMTAVCFLSSLIKKNSSVYDAFWSVIPFYIVLLWLWEGFNSIQLYEVVAFFVVSLWSWRLTLNWARSWSGFHHEDWRYIDLAEKSGKFYPFVNLMGIHVFPTFMVFAGMWPVYYIYQQTLSNAGVFWLGTFVSLLGIWLEFSADNTLYRSKRKPTFDPKKTLDEGLWGKMRYPNYLGEMSFWIGLFIMGIGFNAPWYTATGCTAMVLMFLFISIPMKEERMSKRRSDFDAYKKRVPLLIPFKK